MSNENTLETKKASDAAAAPMAPKPSAGRPSQNRRRASDARSGGPGGRGPGRGGSGPGRGGRPRRPRTNVPAESDYEEKNLEIARVTRVTKGGKRMRFRALSVIGNRKGRVGFGLAKGTDVAGATTKAMTQARKALLTVPIVDETIPHVVRAKFGAAVVLLKPAPKGTGVKAGGAVRTVLELAGVPNIVSKIMGSNNKTNNVKATFEALRQLRTPKTTSSKPEDKKAEKKAA